MKIDDSGITSAALSTISNARLRGAAANSTSSKTGDANSGLSGSADEIDLNSRSSLFSAALTAGEGARTARIQELRQTYGSGNNPITSLELSGAIVDAHLAGR